MERLAGALVLVAALGCAGELSTTLEINGSPGVPGTGPGPDEPLAPGAGPYAWRRLTADELDAAAVALLGDPGTLAQQVLSGSEVGSSGFEVAPLVNRTELERLERWATEVTAAARVRLVPGALLSCDPANARCARDFLRKLGRRAFRRALAPVELEELAGVYSGARSQQGMDGAGALALAVRAVLLSPSFLYVGGLPDTQLAPLDDHALATRLALFLWGTLPDEALLASADQGVLATAEGVSREAERLLADGRASRGVHRFFIQLLHLGQVEGGMAGDPALTAEVRTAAIRETKTFVEEIVLRGDGRQATLLTAPFSWVGSELAPLYGIAASTPEPHRVELLPNRSGLLTQVSVLAAHAGSAGGDPIRRGKLVRENLLCHELSAPPPNIPDLPAPEPGLSLRDRLAAHSADPLCRSCHQYMDPVGFGFDRYDGAGRYHTEREGALVDDSGEVIALDGAAHPFHGPLELGQLLRDSPQAQRCAVAKWLRYALARRERAADRGSVVGLERAFASAGHNVRALLPRIAASEAFRFHGAGAEAAQGYVDLVIESVSVEPAQPGAGDRVTFAAIVRNRGTLASPEGIPQGVTFELDGTTVGWARSSTSSLAPGESRQIVMEAGPNGAAWSATSGAHSLRAYADDLMHLSELSEANNGLERAFQVAAP